MCTVHPPQVFVAGATGQTGRRVLERLAAGGGGVVAGVRNVAKAEKTLSEASTVVRGAMVQQVGAVATAGVQFKPLDVTTMDADALKGALAGSDKLVIALGFVPGNPLKMDSAAHAVDNARRRRIKRPGTGDAARSNTSRRRRGSPEGTWRGSPEDAAAATRNGSPEDVATATRTARRDARPAAPPPRPASQVGTVALVGAAKAAGVKKVVLVSSILTNGRAWGQESSPGFQVTNAFGHVLDEKLVAENALKASGLDYTIVRPGGLKAKPPTGPLVISKEDTLNSGEVSRDLVADVCVAALTDAKAKNKVVEIIEGEGSGTGMDFGKA